MACVTVLWSHFSSDTCMRVFMKSLLIFDGRDYSPRSEGSVQSVLPIGDHIAVVTGSFHN